MDPFSYYTMLSSLIPGALHIISRLTDHFSGGATPQNATELIGLKNADTSQLQTLSQLDSDNNISVWVANIRALQRPVAVVLIVVTWLLMTWNIIPADPDRYYLVSNLCSSAVFYLFGDRTLMYLNRRH